MSVCVVQRRAVFRSFCPLGYLGGKLAPGKFRAGGGHAASDKHFGPALIDDDTPQPQHVRFRPLRLAVLIVLFLALWGVAMAVLPDGTLADMGGFFTKAALVTFGGAYAVLPYVVPGAVGMDVEHCRPWSGSRRPGHHAAHAFIVPGNKIEPLDEVAVGFLDMTRDE